MENKIKDFIKYITDGENRKIKIIVIIGVLGIFLISLPEFLPENSKDSKGSEANAKTDYTAYVAEQENKLEEIIKAIDGAGECKVMITLENTSESVYATDNESRNDDSSASSKDEYVIYDASDGEAPVLIKEYMPKIQGVTVVCSGGDNIQVREKIINTVTALFNISTNRVSVAKIKQ